MRVEAGLPYPIFYGVFMSGWLFRFLTLFGWLKLEDVVIRLWWGDVEYLYNGLPVEWLVEVPECRVCELIHFGWLVLPSEYRTGEVVLVDLVLEDEMA